MSKLKELKKKRNELLEKVRLFKLRNNKRGVSLKKREANVDKSFKMVRELSLLQDEIYVEEEIARTERSKELEKEYGFIRAPRGDLKFRSTSWDDPASIDDYQPSTDEIKARNNLIWQRYENDGALSSDQLVYSYRKFCGERLALRHIASGLKDAGNLSSKQIRFLSEYQSRAQDTTVVSNDDKAGGYLVPTDTEAAIYHHMSRIGPFSGPMGELGRWVNYDKGGKAKVNVNTNVDTLKAKISGEPSDVDAIKASWDQNDLSFYNYQYLMPYTIQIGQDSASNLEQELRFVLSQAIGRGINERIISGSTAAGFVFSGLDALVSTNNTVGTNAFNATQRNANNGPITQKEIVELKTSLNSYYRNNANAAYVFSQDIIDVLENMIDDRKKFLFTKYNNKGQLMVRNNPAIVSDGFAASAASAVAGFFGSWDNLFVGYTRGMYINILRELFMGSLQLGILGHIRVSNPILFNEKAFSKFTYKA